jgi:hypothetical protein
MAAARFASGSVSCDTRDQLFAQASFPARFLSKTGVGYDITGVRHGASNQMGINDA